MKKYTEEEQRILLAIHKAYRMGYEEGTANGAAGAPYYTLTEEELDDMAKDIFEDLFWDMDTITVRDIPDEVDESCYDPYAGCEIFEDYNLGEAEEW